MCLIPKPGTLSQHQALITFYGEQHYLSLCGWCSCEWIHYTTRYSSFNFFPPTLALQLQSTKTPSMAKYQSGSKIYKVHQIFNIHPKHARIYKALSFQWNIKPSSKWKTKWTKLSKIIYKKTPTQTSNLWPFKKLPKHGTLNMLCLLCQH
jgi:hypothetical protein